MNAIPFVDDLRLLSLALLQLLHCHSPSVNCQRQKTFSNWKVSVIARQRYQTVQNSSPFAAAAAVVVVVGRGVVAVRVKFQRKAHDLIVAEKAQWLRISIRDCDTLPASLSHQTI